MIKTISRPFSNFFLIFLKKQFVGTSSTLPSPFISTSNDPVSRWKVSPDVSVLRLLVVLSTLRKHDHSLVSSSVIPFLVCVQVLTSLDLHLIKSFLFLPPLQGMNRPTCCTALGFARSLYKVCNTYFLFHTASLGQALKAMLDSSLSDTNPACDNCWLVKGKLINLFTDLGILFFPFTFSPFLSYS